MRTWIAIFAFLALLPLVNQTSAHTVGKYNYSDVVPSSCCSHVNTECRPADSYDLEGETYVLVIPEHGDDLSSPRKTIQVPKSYVTERDLFSDRVAHVCGEWTDGKWVPRCTFVPPPKRVSQNTAIINAKGALSGVFHFGA